jgi:GT2 family glycosyltransferase
MRRRSWQIQSQGIIWFSFLIPKYRFARVFSEHSPEQVMMMGGNCFFGASHYFKAVWFDPEFAYSYEDIDFTYRLSKANIPLYVTATIVTYHMESQRSALDHKLIGNPTSAYYRMRNFVLFVKKNASPWQKIQAYWFGIWWLYIWFVVNVLLYGSTQRIILLKELTRWLCDGFMYKDLDATMGQKHW